MQYVKVIRNDQDLPWSIHFGFQGCSQSDWASSLTRLGLHTATTQREKIRFHTDRYHHKKSNENKT